MSQETLSMPLAHDWMPVPRNVAVLMLDTDGHIRSLNPHAALIADVEEPCDLIGKHISHHFRLLNGKTGDVSQFIPGNLEEINSSDYLLDKGDSLTPIRIHATLLQDEQCHTTGMALLICTREISRHRHSQNPVDDVFFVRKDNGFVRMHFDDICWIEAMENYAILHGREQKLIVHATMKALEARLSNYGFVRVHRSYLVRMDCVEQIEDQHIRIQHHRIPLGKSYRKGFMQALNIL